MEVAEAFALISRAIETGHVATGYLLVGDMRGQGDVLVDRVLHVLFPDDAAQLEAKTHPDIAYLEPEGKKRIIKVESMRERLIEPMSKTSYSGGWKVGVIMGADRMEAPSANAFLKALEEPTPKTLYFLLTDQPDGILPTIVSRTQRIDLPLSEGLLSGDDYETVAEAFAARDSARLAQLLADLKDAEEDEDVSLVRKTFFKTLMSFVRKLMLDDTSRIPRHAAFRNIQAVEDAYRQSSERAMGDDMVLAFMMDRITFPT